MALQRAYDAASRGGMLAIKRDHGNPFAVFAYIGPAGPDNRFVTFPDAVELFYPHSHIVSIAVQAHIDAAWLDIENGDARPTQARDWYDRAIRRGVWRPGLYANRATMPAVKANMAGVPRGTYRLGVADWDGVAELEPGYDAKQYTNNAHGGQDGPYDSWVLAPDFFPKPSKKPVRKVVGAAGGAAVTAAVLAILHKAGIVHPTPLELGAINSLAAAVAGWSIPAHR